MSELVWGAIREDRVGFAFQPICHSGDRSVILYHECLVRCRDENYRVVPPAEFIPDLERSGEVRLFDLHVFRHAVALLGEHPHITLGVNVSALSAVDDHLWGSVFLWLSDRPEIAHRLVVEITETVPVDPVGAWAFARSLRQVGCRVAVDDFGAGYSSQAATAVEHVDIVKIDASFINGARRNADALCRFDSILASALKIADCIVVEGVENEGDLSLVRRAGIDWVQGYYFGRPSCKTLPLYIQENRHSYFREGH
ncbi:EAL domain-containing protein [Paraburkholderia metrosideri]|uniref:Cyclic di-GMP phosphodiesterase PdeF n=1 Tax=Paraburkholderia metrosideri TaxID=580937 RepID=A0ABM8P5F2_9BURK|nr:EAL domain-containing protein [Paraburkholderia metrosideri]CAD6556841.1 Cyclic di-GMP phosphodiesterase PdeF [Paraburkholderia metrosideri]